MTEMASADLTSTLESFIGSGWLEWTGVFTGILCVWLAAKNNILNWPVAIVNVSIYGLIFFDSKLYSDMGLQICFILINGYGWYYWSKRKDKTQQPAPVINISKSEIIISLISILLLTTVSGFFLHQHTQAAYPYIDSFCTACSLVAQALLARRVIQNWLIWIAVDFIYVAVYISRDLKPTALMYCIYIYIAWMGYREWKKTYIEQT